MTAFGNPGGRGQVQEGGKIEREHGESNMFGTAETCSESVSVCLLDDTAAGRWVVSADFVLIAVDVVGVSVAFPLVLHLRDGDQLHCLPLRGGGEDSGVQ